MTYVAVESVAELKAHWRAHGILRHVVAKGLDLRGETEFLESVDAHCAVFLGCRMEAEALDRVIETGGVVFPRLREMLELPFSVYRDRLYSVPELMEGLDVGRPGSLLEDTLDGRIYRWFRQRREERQPAVLEALAERLHDHAIEDEAREFLAAGPADVVGIMGGHALSRADPVYADVTRLGRALARKGWRVVTGGGPGAMEAGNLGAWLAPLTDDTLDRALAILAPSPTFDEDPERYLAFGYDALAALSLDPRSPVDGRGGESLAVPTWYYGHEPSNQFATHVAKYFANSMREAGLVTIATRGLVFAPGSAGTVQEIFMDATQNFYGTEGLISPMVLLDSAYWSNTLPVERLLRRLAAKSRMGALVAVLDDVDEVVAFLESNPARRVQVSEPPRAPDRSA
jgi:predicted Rossmann-fold nucleotide-binding protein